MSIERLLTLDVVITNPEAPGEEVERDEFGDPVVVAGEPVTYKGWYEQIQRSEDTAGMDQQSERWRLFLEPRAAGQVSGSATAGIGEAGFEFDGPPWSATHPRTGRVSHVEATMRRTV